MHPVFIYTKKENDTETRTFSFFFAEISLPSLR